MTPVKLLEELAKKGGNIVASGSCSEYEIAHARACNRFAVSDDGIGFVHRLAASATDGATPDSANAGTLTPQVADERTSQSACLRATDEGDDMLMRWASCLADRRTITEFWEWLVQQPTDSSIIFGHRVLDVHIEKALDSFHEIDQVRLEKQRRALLEMFTDGRRPTTQALSGSTNAAGGSSPVASVSLPESTAQRAANGERKEEA